MDVLVTENIVGQSLDDLAKLLDVQRAPTLWGQPNALAEQVASARALIVRNQTQVTSDLLAAAPNLQIVARAGAGLDNVDVEAASRLGIVLTSTPIQNSISVAEMTIGLMISLARRIPPADRHVKSGGWARAEFYGTELFGKTLGIVGFGRIGFLTAMRARAFGMRIMAHDPYADPDSLWIAEAGVQLTTLEQLLAEADFVSCHLPGGQATRGMFDYDRFCAMKPSAFFINAARGQVVEEAGLASAIQEARIAGAALDVRQQEPPAASPLDALDNVILLPHIAAFTNEAQDRVLASVCRDVAAVLEGKPAASFVNFATPRRSAD